MAENEKILSPEAPTGTAAAPKTERPSVPERFKERPVSSGIEIPVQATPAPTPAATASAPTTFVSAEAQQLADIERILEEDLSDLYFRLPEDKKAEFRKQGEETAREINVLLSAAKIKVAKIVSLIRDWLKLIPGINRLFLEQEAKIKADRLLKLNNRL